MYYGRDDWWIAPELLIPAAVLWVCLDMLCDRLKLSDTISPKTDWSKRSVQRWIHGINFVISLIIIT